MGKFDGDELRCGEQCLANLFLRGLLVAGPVGHRGHVVDDEHAVRAEIGLTALYPIEDAGAGLSSSQTAARREIESLVEALDLPGRTPGIEHLQSRRLWHDRVAKHYRELGALPDWRAS